MDWDPRFLERSPMLAPLAPVAGALADCGAWPRLEALQALISARGVCNRLNIPIRLVLARQGTRAPYEERIYLRGELPVREGEWHDLFNVLAWLTYPRAKAALNARHYTALKAGREGDRQVNRGPVGNALTLFDENGALVASSDPALIEDVRAFRWKRLYWERRARVIEHARFHVFGHALFEKALKPYVGITAHAMLFSVTKPWLAEPMAVQIEHLDGLVADRIDEGVSLATPRTLAPLPLLGVPGWWAANKEEAFYDDASYFRRGRG